MKVDTFIEVLALGLLAIVCVAIVITTEEGKSFLGEIIALCCTGLAVVLALVSILSAITYLL